MTCQILGKFLNRLTASDKYPVWDCESLSSPIQMQLSLKPEIFSLLSVSNFKHFEKKDDRHGDFILEITDNERLG